MVGSRLTVSRYDVETPEDLLHEKALRIVKLHGRLPSQRKVATEQDQGRYSVDHATLVNTVRESLLEKALCLGGFSGDDPDFLQRIG